MSNVKLLESVKCLNCLDRREKLSRKNKQELKVKQNIKFFGYINGCICNYDRLWIGHSFLWRA